uniref:Uncharacterized protein n=1 Tax=Cacopsylla melanoneura TaxID=428564 RepID=A0A8D8SL44_9HEMI
MCTSTETGKTFRGFTSSPVERASRRNRATSWTATFTISHAASRCIRIHTPSYASQQAQTHTSDTSTTGRERARADTSPPSLQTRLKAGCWTTSRCRPAAVVF